MQAVDALRILRIWPGIASGNEWKPDQIASDPTCGSAWDLFFQIDKVSRVLGIAIDKPWIPELGSSGVYNKAEMAIVIGQTE
jgi:hypothetical protein